MHKTRDLLINSLVMGPRPHLSFCACKTTVRLAHRFTSLYGSLPSSVVLHAKQRLIASELQVSMCPSFILLICMQNNAKQSCFVDLGSRSVTHVYWFQPSSVVLCIQNNDFSFRITSLNGSQTLFVVFACKTANFGSELQVSVGTRPHLSFSACKTAWLAPEVLVSRSPSSHLLFLHAKQHLLGQNY